MTDKEYLQALVREAVEDTLYEFKSDLKRDVAARNQHDKMASRYGHTEMGKDGMKLPKYGEMQRGYDSNDHMWDNNGRAHNKRDYQRQNARNAIATAYHKSDKLGRSSIDQGERMYKKAKAAVGESFYAGDLNDREIIDAYCEGYLSDADIAEGFQNDIVSEAVLSYISEID
jgi:hypothetical protein